MSGGNHQAPVSSSWDSTERPIRGFSTSEERNRRVYAQYFGFDSGVPSGMHVSDCIPIQYHSD